MRSASNSVLLLAEGANRRGAAAKRQRFVESRGECGEVAAAGDLIIAMKIGARPEVERLKALAGRVSAMLTGLICRLEQARWSCACGWGVGRQLRICARRHRCGLAPLALARLGFKGFGFADLQSVLSAIPT